MKIRRKKNVKIQSGDEKMRNASGGENKSEHEHIHTYIHTFI